MSTLIYNQGQALVNVPAGQSVAVFTRNKASVRQAGNYPNQPSSFAVLGSVNGGTVVFGPFVNATTLEINGGAGDTLFSVGTAPIIQELAAYHQQQAPVALNATGNITASGLLAGLITSTTAAAVTATLPTGAQMDAASSINVLDTTDWSVINTGANAFTVTAAAGHTLVGSGVVAAGASASFATTKTATGTFVTYRLA